MQCSTKNNSFGSGLFSLLLYIAFLCISQLCKISEVGQSVDTMVIRRIIAFHQLGTLPAFSPSLCGYPREKLKQMSLKHPKKKSTLNFRQANPTQIQEPELKFYRSLIRILFVYIQKYLPFMTSPLIQGVNSERFHSYLSVISRQMLCWEIGIAPTLQNYSVVYPSPYVSSFFFQTYCCLVCMFPYVCSKRTTAILPPWVSDTMIAKKFSYKINK